MKTQLVLIRSSLMLTTLLFIVSGIYAQDQLSIHNFENTPSASDVSDGISVSDVTITSGNINYQAGADDGGDTIGNGSSWNQSDFDPLGKYLQFSVTTEEGYRLDFSSLGFRFGRTSAGPTQVTIQISEDGFDSPGTTILSNGTVSSENVNSLDAFDVSDNLPAGDFEGTLTIRIWGHNASSTGNFRFNNFRIWGTVEEIMLPVTLLSFQARNTGSEVILDWSFTDAVGFERFSIEHSVDAHHWQEIGSVEYTQSPVRNMQANYVHHNPPSGTNYYRLRMIDIDGSSDLSPVRHVMVTKQSSIALRNSVATSTLTIDHDPGLSDGTVFIYDATGRLLSAHPMDAGAHSTVVHVNVLMPGLYYARALYDGLSETMCFIKD